MKYITPETSIDDTITTNGGGCLCGSPTGECYPADNNPDADNPDIRHDWKNDEILALFEMPMMDLLYQAQTMHRKYQTPNMVQLSTLMNIKSGGCSEDCKYCAQSARYAKETGLKAAKLVDVDTVIQQAKAAKENGSGRFCMGAAWRELKPRDLEKIGEIVTAVKDLGMETCMTLGMLEKEQAKYLKDSGLDYYNHNLDTSEEYYPEVITTRSYSDRLNTLENVRQVGLNVCSGGIIGMGEKRTDRAGLLKSLANMPKHPGSVPINMLVPVAGTPMGDLPPIEHFEFIRTIAAARLVMPRSYVRLSAGRKQLSDEAQAMAFMAGANSIFYGETLLTTDNPLVSKDQELFKKLGMVTTQQHMKQCSSNNECM